MKNYLLNRSLALLATCWATLVQGQTFTAIQVPLGTIGNQQLPANQTQTSGDDFNVNSPITISSLGVFDSGADGLLGTLVARIYDRNTQQSLASISFSGMDGTLVGGFRFLNLATPLTLSAGFQGVISAAYLGNPLEAQGNVREAGSHPWTADTGGGLISFVGEGRHSLMGTGDVFPNYVDPSPSAINFCTASFSYTAVPEPTALALSGLVSLAALVVARRRM